MTESPYLEHLVDILAGEDSFFVQLQCFSVHQQRRLCNVTYVRRSQVYGIDFAFARRNKTCVSWITEASCRRVTGRKVDVFHGMELAASRIIARLPPFVAAAYLTLLKVNAHDTDDALKSLIHAFIWSHQALENENIKLFLLDGGGASSISVPANSGVTKTMHKKAREQDEQLYEAYFANIKENRGRLSSHTHTLLAAIRETGSNNMYYLAAFNGEFLTQASACGYAEKDVPTQLRRRYHHLFPGTLPWDHMLSTSKETAMTMFETSLENCATCNQPCRQRCHVCDWAQLCHACADRRTTVQLLITATADGVKLECLAKTRTPLHTFCPYLRLTREALTPV